MISQRIKLTHILGVLVVFLLLSAVSLSVTANLNAQVPEPYVECGQTATPEWHSLRPYQASPCEVPINVKEQALLCGNDLVVKDAFIIDVKQCDCPDTPCPGQIVCFCQIDREFSIEINAYDSELPIAGNTELIPAGQTSLISAFSNEKRLSDWNGNLPPDPNDFSSFKEYYIEYQEWRGKKCADVMIPIINKVVMFCFDNPADPNFFSALFPYIPYSSTEDRIGKDSASDMFLVQADFTVENLITEWKEKLDDVRNATTKNNEGVLYFPHMEENVELSAFLQSTFVGKDSLGDPKAQEIKSDDVEPPTIGSQCKIVDVRSNPGDQLFGEQINAVSDKKTGAPAADVSYTAVFYCDAYNEPVDDAKDTCIPVGTCPRSGIFASTVDTFTPMADDLWSRTVAGNSSVFRKIYPKVGTDTSPLEKIKDIPAQSDVEHISSVEVLSDPAKLYFPHFGGMYDYFLMGIQTALRPQGFEGLPAGLPDDQPIAEADQANEYLSWYLNGTLFRAEKDPVGHIDVEEVNRLTGFSGPLNKLLPQEIQWRTKLTQKLPTDNRISRVGQIERAGENRHDQIVACTRGAKVFGWLGWVPWIGDYLEKIEIGGFPSACTEDEFESIGDN